MSAHGYQYDRMELQIKIIGIEKCNRRSMGKDRRGTRGDIRYFTRRCEKTTNDTHTHTHIYTHTVQDSHIPSTACAHEVS